jgi:hypothetical protein
MCNKLLESIQWKWALAKWFLNERLLKESKDVSDALFILYFAYGIWITIEPLPVH